MLGDGAYPLSPQASVWRNFAANQVKIYSVHPSQALLRAPLQTQFGFYQFLYFWHEPSLTMTSAFERLALGLLLPITGQTNIVMQFPTDRRFMSSNHLSCLCSIMTHFQKNVNLVMLILLNCVYLISTPLIFRSLYAYPIVAYPSQPSKLHL